MSREVKKCCPLGQAFNSSGKCDLSGALDLLAGLEDVSLAHNGTLPCDKFLAPPPWNLLPNGSLLLPEEPLPVVDFCLESFRGRLEPFVCLETADPVREAKFLIYPVGMFVSVPFLLATLFVYAVLPVLRDTVNGKSVLSYLAAMVLAYSVLATLQLFPNDVSESACVILAYIMQFAFLATFFWLNVMCFDIWWAFSSLKKPGGSVRERDRKKFVMYSLYAWGLPFIILSITLVMDYSDLLPPDHKLRPMMGEEKCFFESIEATWLYLYGPMAVIIVANLIMFAITAKRIYLHSRETRVLQSDDSRRHDSKDKERFNLYLKLFIVMGVNWVAELVSWTFKTPSSVWYITDITNTLQGVIIFIIFVCKRRVLRLLEARLCPVWSINRSNHTVSNRSRMTATTSAGSKDSNGNAKTAEVLKLKDFNDVDNSA